MSESYYAVSLTQTQRSVIADVLPRMIDRLQPEVKRPAKVEFTPAELKMILTCIGEVLPRAGASRKLSSIRRLVVILQEAIQDAHGIGAIPRSKRLYQFRISLLGTNPPIWRRIQTRDCSMDKLHEHIQTAMGWTNSHLHRFEILGIDYGDPVLLCGEAKCFVGVNSLETRVSEVVPRSGIRFQFTYEYDFGDRWRHEVLFEGCLAAADGVRYPLCVEGERACPPEDVGGAWGYEEFLKVIADPSHEYYLEWREWAGRDFDPSRFEPASATKAMQQGLPNWRQLEVQC